LLFLPYIKRYSELDFLIPIRITFKNILVKNNISGDKIGTPPEIVSCAKKSVLGAIHNICNLFQSNFKNRIVIKSKNNV